MASKTILDRKELERKEPERKKSAVPVQKDPDVLAAAARMSGEDLCSIADLSSAEVRAIMKLGHDVKRNPRDYRNGLDAKQMVLMFEKASLRTRTTFEAARTPWAATRFLSTRPTRRWARAQNDCRCREEMNAGWM